ncbi:uncharacterized protein [Antedon mediterranea]|uniref:uncharacterized protein n=1 Tax=Antedon mediterranea TaxID=105859 RepID=UPI003AF75969
MAIQHTAAFVFVIIIGCNLVLYPSLFSKLFRQWFGGPDTKQNTQNSLEDIPPQMRGRPPFQGPASAHRQNSMPERATFGPGKVQEPGYKGVMGTILPVYAVGIMVYFVFVIYKVFLKEKPSKNPLTGRQKRDAHNPTSVDRRLREEEEILQKRLSEELRKHGYGVKPTSTTTGANLERAAAAAKSNSEAEVAVLQSRLEQTERTMAKMMEMMTTMGISMSSEMFENNEEKSENAQDDADEYIDEDMEEESDSQIECSDNCASSEEEEEYDHEDEVDEEIDEDSCSESEPEEVENIGTVETIEDDEGTVRRRKNVTTEQQD